MNRLVGSSTIHTMREEFNGNAPVIYVVCAINNVKTVINLLEWEEYIRLSVSQICALYIRSRYRFTKKTWRQNVLENWNFPCYTGLWIYILAIQSISYTEHFHVYFIWFLYYYLCEKAYIPYLLKIRFVHDIFLNIYFTEYIYGYDENYVKRKFIFVCFFFLVRNTGSVYVRICVNTQWRHIIYNFIFIY